MIKVIWLDGSATEFSGSDLYAHEKGFFTFRVGSDLVYIPFTACRTVIVAR